MKQFMTRVGLCRPPLVGAVAEPGAIPLKALRDVKDTGYVRMGSGRVPRPMALSDSLPAGAGPGGWLYMESQHKLKGRLGMRFAVGKYSGGIS